MKKARTYKAIVIGSSAGGLAALKAILLNLKPGFTKQVFVKSGLCFWEKKDCHREHREWFDSSLRNSLSMTKYYLRHPEQVRRKPDAPRDSVFSVAKKLMACTTLVKDGRSNER